MQVAADDNEPAATSEMPVCMSLSRDLPRGDPRLS
jgi:hypothetical protein